jgi:hypothetical protein
MGCCDDEHINKIISNQSDMPQVGHPVLSERPKMPEVAPPDIILTPPSLRIIGWYWQRVLAFLPDEFIYFSTG